MDEELNNIVQNAPVTSMLTYFGNFICNHSHLTQETIYVFSVHRAYQYTTAFISNNIRKAPGLFFFTILVD